MNEKSEFGPQLDDGVVVAFGLSLGLILGMMLDQLALGLAIGSAIVALIGVISHGRRVHGSDSGERTSAGQPYQRRHTGSAEI